MESDTRLGDMACQFCVALTPVNKDPPHARPAWDFCFRHGNAADFGGVAAHY